MTPQTHHRLSTLFTYLGMLLVGLGGCAATYPKVEFWDPIPNQAEVEDEIREAVQWFAEQRGVDPKHFASCLHVRVRAKPFTWPGLTGTYAGLYKACDLHVAWPPGLPDNALFHELWHRWDRVNGTGPRNHSPDFYEDFEADQDKWRARGAGVSGD